MSKKGLSSLDKVAIKIDLWRPTNYRRYMPRERYDAYYLHKGEMYVRHFERVLRRPDPKPHAVEKYPGDLIRRLRKARGVGQVKHLIKQQEEGTI